MEPTKNLTLAHAGLKCDTEGCDWKDDSISPDQWREWINARCPKCGANLLTLEDFQNAQTVMLAAEAINALTPEELEEFGKTLSANDVDAAQYFSGIPGAELLDGKGEERVVIKVDTHKEVKIVGFKKENNE